MYSRSLDPDMLQTIFDVSSELVPIVIGFAFLASRPYLLMFTNLTTPTFLASASYTVVLTDRSTPTLLAHPRSSPMWTFGFRFTSLYCHQHTLVPVQLMLLLLNMEKAERMAEECN